MCGIAGAVGLRDNSSLERIVERIVEDQIPRGPDFQACESYLFDNRKVVLGHDRLSIIDLSATANQPMVDVSGRWTIVFNGEIYNYVELRDELAAAGARFRTASDTEVILAAFERWGTESFARLFGMFAFALLDKQSGDVWLVRDRFGVKPLYVAATPSCVVFASTTEVMARELGLAPNLHYVGRGIRHKIYDDDEGIAAYEGMRQVAPGGWERIRANGRSFDCEKGIYYDLAAAVEQKRPEVARLAYPDAKRELARLLDDAVRLRLRADVPVGVSLSGGVDSSLISALVAKRKDSRLVGYTFGHPDDASSEGPLVSQLVRKLDIDVNYVEPRATAERMELFWRTMKVQDAPFPNLSICAMHAVFRAARAQRTLVLLGGQAGDEAFMGYRKFLLFYAREELRRSPLTAVPRLLRTIGPAAPAIMSRGLVFWTERHRYLRSEGRETPLKLPDLPPLGMGLDGMQSLQARQISDVTRFSLPTLLRYEDRNSTGNSVESRLPLIDHRVVEFGLALNVEAKLHRGFGKWILRDLSEGLVPDTIRLNRDKRGFDVNDRRWITEGMGGEIRKALHARSKAIREWLPADHAIDERYSDERLSTPTTAFVEAVSLLWLAGKV